MQYEKFEKQLASALDCGPLQLAVIIPTFNESENVQPLLAKLSVVLAGIHWEAIFVDDNSPDGTASIVREIALDNRNVRIVHRVGRRGLSSAVIEGMLASPAPVLAVIDGDMQHDENALPQLFDLVASGAADIAVGSRYCAGGGVSDWDQKRLFASKLATWIGQRTLKANLTDPMSGFFAISREALMRALPNTSGIGFKILLDLVASMPAPPKIAEVSYTFKSRIDGESKAGALVGLEYLSLLIDKTIGRYIPSRLINFLAVGGLGVIVQLSVLGLLLACGLSFLPAEISAVACAITFNFVLNNVFTYRDRRLMGWKAVGGLLSYFAVCSIGAVANIGIGTWMNHQDGRWWLAGLAGVLVGAVWNFAASSVVTWRK